ncbi:SPOSA6832_03068 [Sporobolomyces salmonicolor]|uniref:3'(2'),5'-bisphosphate nucleotidase n=1 Tax=Sporidiobolus salmonicolor TaxID=5005 RepID=A0A0D6EP26_SPOSA|nr:SPOSA6832_03068 [Sporobolomyces salmonicolor]
MSNLYAQEQQVAISAVLKASLVAQKVQDQLIGSGGVQKKDKSPVTVGDYTSQALISSLLFAHFPSDQIVGEEDSSELQTPENSTTKANIVRLANEALSDVLPVAQEEAAWAPVKAQGGDKSEKEWLEIIDRGNSTGGKEGRHWALDPIDGTKGFLRGGQYAVCLGLLKDGEVVLGVMGCPNLPVDPKQPEGEKGALFVAVKGQGAFQRSFTSPTLTPIRMASLPSLSAASFCESVEAGHSDHGTNARIAALLGITKDSVRMDSQAKYCSIARGDGDIYLRLPVSETYEEKIWVCFALLYSRFPFAIRACRALDDAYGSSLRVHAHAQDHSSGSLLVAEAGGIVSDMHGKPLDFSLGRTLKGNKGVVAAHRDWHAKVIEAVKQAVEESKQ